MIMPNVNEMLPSSYLKKEDCDPPILVTIADIKQENLAMEGKPSELKWVMFFAEHEKGIVLNSTNIQLAASICASQNTDDWIGKRIVLYSDPNVSFGGKLVGGIRIRAAKLGPAKPMTQPIVSDVNRKMQEAADAEDFQRSGADQEF